MVSFTSFLAQKLERFSFIVVFGLHFAGGRDIFFNVICVSLTLKFVPVIVMDTKYIFN